jgi:hypothetical protein
LERDRAAVLTVRSAVRGVVDYREADIVDRKWWRRWRLLLNEMMSQEDRDLMEHLYSYHLALVSNSGLTEDSFKSTQQSARDNFEDIAGGLRPWIGKTKEDRALSAKEEMKEDWKNFFGWDLDDPEAYETWKKEMGELKEEAAGAADRRNAGPEEEMQRLEDARERIRERRAAARRNG